MFVFYFGQFLFGFVWFLLGLTWFLFDFCLVMPCFVFFRFVLLLLLMLPPFLLFFICSVSDSFLSFFVIFLFSFFICPRSLFDPLFFCFSPFLSAISLCFHCISVHLLFLSLHLANKNKNSKQNSKHKTKAHEVNILVILFFCIQHTHRTLRRIPVPT